MFSQNVIVAAFYFIAIPYKSIARRVYVTCFFDPKFLATDQLCFISSINVYRSKTQLTNYGAVINLVYQNTCHSTQLARCVY